MHSRRSQKRFRRSVRTRCTCFSMKASPTETSKSDWRKRTVRDSKRCNSSSTSGYSQTTQSSFKWSGTGSSTNRSSTCGSSGTQKLSCQTTTWTSSGRFTAHSTSRIHHRRASTGTVNSKLDFSDLKQPLNPCLTRSSFTWSLTKRIKASQVIKR